MKQLIAASCLFLLGPVALADTTTQGPNPRDVADAQAQRREQALIKACTEKAADRKGDERKRYIDACVKR